MAFFGHAKRKHIVIDLGSHFIKTAIFEKPAGKETIPENINKTVTKLTVTSRNRSFANLHELLTSLLNEYKSPEEIMIGISPSTADISFQEWKIDSLHLREALTKAHIQKYFQQLFSEHREENRAFLGYPVSIDINGYPVDIRSFIPRDPSTIKEITLHTVMLRFPDEVGSELGDIKKVFSGVNIEYIPVHAVMAEVLSATCGINHGLLIDVGASVTTIMLIHNGLLAQVVSFAVGMDRFSHRIMKTRGGKFVEAQDITRQYAQGLISKEEQMKLSHVFSKETEEWKKSFIRALEVCYPVAPLPEHFYLYGEGSYLPEVRSALWAHDVLKNFSPFESPIVHVIQGSQIFNNSPLSGTMNGPEDVGLASLIYYSLHHTPLF